MSERPQITLGKPPADSKPEPLEDQADTSTQGDVDEQAPSGPLCVGTAYGGSEAMKVNRGIGLDAPGDQAAASPQTGPPAARQLYRDVAPQPPEPARRPYAWVALAPVLALLVGVVIWLNPTNMLEAKDVTLATESSQRVLVNAQFELPDLQTVEAVKVHTPELTLPDSDTCHFYSANNSGMFARSDAPETHGQFIVLCGDEKLYIAERTQRIKGVWTHRGLTPYD